MSSIELFNEQHYGGSAITIDEENSDLKSLDFNDYMSSCKVKEGT